jgi:hypothetical protein
MKSSVLCFVILCIVLTFEFSASEGNPKCEAPKSSGMCRGALTRFWFNPKTKECEEFYYGGCGGNENNYESPDECEASCGAKKSP